MFFILYSTCIGDNQFTTLNQQEAQYCSIEYHTE